MTPPKYRYPTMDRRSFMRVSAATLASATILSGCGDTEESSGVGGDGSPELEDIDAITIATWGGTTGAGMVESWAKPFTERTGVEVIEVTPVDYAKFVTQVESGNLQWDWIDAEGWFVFAHEDLLDPIDLDAVGVNEGDMVEVPQMITPKAIGSHLGSYVIGYRTDVEGRNVPRDWTEFFDVKNIPGKRVLYNWPYGMVEVALLGDGVEFEDLYPLDLDRAFDKIDSIRDDLLFWNTGAEAQQFLASDAADFVATWNNRIGYLANAGIPVGIEWGQNLQILDHHTVPKGDPRAPATIEFIRTALEPQAQADLAFTTGLAPTRESAFQLVDDRIKPWLNTHPDNWNAAAGILDDEWWGGNLDRVTTAWYEWVG